MVFAWWMPGSAQAAVLAWISVILLVFTFRHSRHLYRDLYLLGLIEHLGGFYWLAGTIEDFGDFPRVAAFALLLLFAVVSSLQQLLVVAIYRHATAPLGSLALRLATAWTLVEVFMPRLFPWLIGHTQLGVLHLTQIADIAGAYGITFLMLWVAEAIVQTIEQRRVSFATCTAAAALLGTIAYGHQRIAAFNALPAATQEVALVQGNIAVAAKHDPGLFEQNSKIYRELSAPFVKPGALIVWPESAVMQWLPAGIGRIENDRKRILPRGHLIDGAADTDGSTNSAGSTTTLGASTPAGVGWLIGGLTFDPPDRAYNSAIAILEDGTIPPPYHKQILMPFGEYTPFANLVPYLRELNGTSGDFTAGTDLRVFDYRAPGVRMAALICYEDLVPDLSRRAVREGATLLVNLTNDAWYGDTPAPFQHHQIAAFRAIENHRYLLRVTNSGLTAAVDPLGQTIAQLPIFTAGVLNAKIAPRSDATLYSSSIGTSPWQLLAVVALLIAASSPFRKKTRS